MNDQNRFDTSLLGCFNEVNYPKDFLSARNSNEKNVVYIYNYKDKDDVEDMYNDKHKCLLDFDLVSWIKGQI